jgi:hypothetical protein
MSKAGRPKKDSARLPGWFDIEKYRQVKSYGAAEWFQQLAFRLFVYDWLTDENGPGNLGNEWRDLLQTDPHITIARLEKAYPITSVIEQDDIEFIARGLPGDLIIDDISLTVQPVYGVRMATNKDIYEAYKALPQALHKPIPIAPNTTTAESQKEKAAWLSRYCAPYTGNNLNFHDNGSFVRVDLSLPDALLEKQFVGYLKAQRKNAEKAACPFFKSPDFNNWYNSGILAYLDLLLWETDANQRCQWGEIETRQTFQWTAFVDALDTITDKPVISEDACRKTAKALASKLLDRRTIRILNFQAVKELAEGHKKSGKLFVR